MKKLILTILVVGIVGVSFADISPGLRRPILTSSDDRAADCEPAKEKLFLEFNNIKALIETGGSMWQDRATSRASYEYPRGSSNHVLFSGAYGWEERILMDNLNWPLTCSALGMIFGQVHWAH